MPNKSTPKRKPASRSKPIDKKAKIKKALESTVEKVNVSSDQLEKAIINKVDLAIHSAVSNFRSDIVSKLTELIENGTPNFLLPEGTRLFRKLAGNNYVIAREQKPVVRSVDINIIGNQSRFYRLAFPYMLFISVYKEDSYGIQRLFTIITYTKGPLSAAEDILFHPNLPNINYNFEHRLKVEAVDNWRYLISCLGEGFSDRYLPPSNDVFITHNKNLMDWFWGSSFNNDLISGYLFYSEEFPEYLADVSTWEAQTKKDPTFMQRLDWVPAIKFNELIEKIEGWALNSPTDGKLLDLISNLYKDASKGFKSNAKNSLLNFKNLATNEKKAVLKNFTANLSKGLSVLNINSTIIGHIQRCIFESANKSFN